MVSSDRFGWPLGAGIDERVCQGRRGPGLAAATPLPQYSIQVRIAAAPATDDHRALKEVGVMTSDDAPYKPDSETRQRMQQIEGILRRLKPELTDKQVEELMVQFAGGPV